VNRSGGAGSTEWAVTGGTAAPVSGPDGVSPDGVSPDGAAPDDAPVVEVADPDAVPPDPAWTRPALAGLLVVTAVTYLWNIGSNGWSNSFYAAAVQAGTKSWSSFFFGSFDWGDYITVDKPPASLWIMELSGRIFGFSSWSMLAPQALLGVASVALLFAAVRRVWGAPAGLLAGAVLALTPAAALMFRFNNPDAALTFFLVAAVYTLTRALERASTRWLLFTAFLVGTAFLAKSLQALLVVPGLGLAYLVVAPAGWLKRCGQLAGAVVVLAVSGLWWPLLVDAIPAGSRPYIGGSTTNSVVELALGYNGLNRITGGEGGGPGGGAPGGAPGGGAFGGGGPGGGGGFGGTPGLGRLFNTEFAGFIAWLVPAALVGLLAGIWLVARAGRTHRPARRTDQRWGSLIVWGGWTLVTGGVLSYMGGIVHSYYTVALAPGVAALAAMVVPALWRRRAEALARVWLAAMALVTAGTAYALLGRAGDWLPWLRVLVLVGGVAGAAALLLPSMPSLPAMPTRSRPATARLAAVGGVVALAAGLAGPLAWSVETLRTPHTGSVPTVGPAGQGGGFGGGFGGGAFAGRRLRDLEELAAGGQAPAAGGGQLPGAGQVPGIGQMPGAGQLPNLGQMPGAGGFGGPGGPGEGGAADQALVSLLTKGAAGYRWVAATGSSQTAGPLQLSADVPVMSIGGFSGGDSAITLDRFKELVAQHRIHYYVGGSDGRGGGFGGGFGGPGGQGASSSIATWVSSTFTATTVGSATVYDLTAPATTSTTTGATTG